MNDRAELLVALLDARCGVALDAVVARETISDHLDRVAAGMRIGRQAAKRYVTDDVIARMADRIAAAVHEAEAEAGAAPEPAVRRPKLRIVE